MAKASTKSRTTDNSATKKRGKTVPDPLSERLAFDIDRFDDFVMGSKNPIDFMKGGGLANESFQQLRLFSVKHRWIIGVDEVGRGCLAGPVVASAVILPGFEKDSEIATRLAQLDDSKKLPAPVREELARTIRGCAHVAVAEASPEEIDTINIFHASLLAMKRAVKELVASGLVDLKEALILIDGKWRLPEMEANQLPIIKGDTKSAAIAAASIVAKVYRDALMVRLGKDFPAYKWHSNKGYPSITHRQAIEEHGMTVWHRRSFRCLPDVELGEDGDEGEQLHLLIQKAKKNGKRKAGKKAAVVERKQIRKRGG